MTLTDRRPSDWQPPCPYPGAVDADGHILEPPDLWLSYLEGKFTDRAIRIVEDSDGYEHIVWGDIPYSRDTPGGAAALGAMGRKLTRSPDQKYMDCMPYGGCDPGERLDLLDMENLERAVLYPSLGILWEQDVTDPEISLAYMRAYNRWIADFCRDSAGRLIPIAQLTLSDLEGSIIEMERAVNDGCRGAFVGSFTHTRKAHGHPDHDALWAKAEELDIPITIHPLQEPGWCSVLTRYDDLPENTGAAPNPLAASWNRTLVTHQRVVQAFLSFFAYQTLERFPSLRLGVLESGAGWIGFLLDRMEHAKPSLPTSDRPLDIFRRQCFISADPDEVAVTNLIDAIGNDRFMWASDYPHPDHAPTYVTDAVRLVESLSEEARPRVLGTNVVDIYRLN
jgi:uncharacterized protein